MSATAVLRKKFDEAIDADDPTLRNSNLLPVKANGEVLFLSVESFGSAGNVETPVSNIVFSVQEQISPAAI